MDYETYKNRYDAAYAKNAKRINLMDGGYSDEELREAHRLYCNPDIWYWRAFKPSSLATTNIEFYEYQIRQALEWAGYDYSDEELRDVVANYPDGVKEVVKKWARETGMRKKA